MLIDFVSAKLVFVTEENAINTDNFIINADDSSSSFVDLEFGSALGVKMRYDILNNKFVLNRDLELNSNLLDENNDPGIPGQVLSTTATGTDWITNSSNPIPFISTSIIQKVSTSSTQTIIINGELFTPTSTVSFPGFAGTVNSISVTSSSEIEINITTTAATGIYDIIVSNNGVLNTEWSGNGTGLLEVANLTILTPGDGTTNWIRISANVATSLRKLVPTITGAAWNKAASFGTVPAGTNFELEFNPVYMTGQSSGGYAMIGMDNSDPNFNYNTIDYAIYLQNGSNLMIYENGGSKGTHGTWTTSDLLMVRRTGTLIECLKNGTVFYTSLTPSTTAMEFDSSMYRHLGAENIKLTY